ncbi:SRP40, C-terminal domain-containing protein [Spinellus fusiger]|nr:SRP40, C-terminal domain-containing protein [Spinellus fusiger]
MDIDSKSSSDSDPSSDSSSSDSDSSSDSSSSDSDSSSKKSSADNDSKKRKAETVMESPAVKKTATQKPLPKVKGPRTPGTPFQRVKPEEVEFVDERLKDNSYVNKGGSDEMSYGWKAHVDLIKTRGDKFRAEKNKKKRGAYRGGAITFESHSIKFDA